jgi:hypothetical protein
MTENDEECVAHRAVARRHEKGALHYVAELREIEVKRTRSCLQIAEIYPESSGLK